MAGQLRKVDELATLPRRRRDAHKGDFGRVLVVGGSPGMIGAVSLAANAALRSGAGLVTFAAPRSAQPTIAALCPCATSIPLDDEPAGRLAPTATRQLAEAIRHCDVAAVGPGMGRSPAAANLVRVALQRAGALVLDADGLNNLALIDDWPAKRNCPLVLTPHPGEFAALTGRAVEDIQSDRIAAAAAAVRQWSDQVTAKGPPLVCVLKGAGTVVIDGEKMYVNDTGNPGMATGGAGDVLTGVLAGLIGQGMDLFDAASVAVHVHGRAGDLAAERLGELSVTAGDILDFLPQAFIEAS